jgi:hypothetical protein
VTGVQTCALPIYYQEKTFAAGKIPGGYFKREGRPTEKETLTSRLIDRPIRPLFVAGFKHETQVVATEEVEPRIPLQPGETAADYKVYVGLRLTPDELQYNQQNR